MWVERTLLGLTLHIVCIEFNIERKHLYVKQVTSIKLLLLHSCTRPQGLLVYLLVNSILKIMVHLQVLYSELEDQQVAPPT